MKGPGPLVVGLLLLGLAPLGTATGAGRLAVHSHSTPYNRGDFERLRGLSRLPRDQPARRSRFWRLDCALAAAGALTGTSSPSQQKLVLQQQRQGLQQRLETVTPAAPSSSWPSTATSSSGAQIASSSGAQIASSSGAQIASSRRRLAQSLWDVVGSLLQQAQQQVQHARSSRQLATDSREIQEQLWDMPGDPTAGELVLQSLQPLLALPPFSARRQPQQPSTAPSSSSSTRKRNSSSSSSDNIRSFAYQGHGAALLALQVVFTPVANMNASLRLPLPPRTFYVTIKDMINSGNRGVCGDKDLVYKDQTVTCQGLDLGKDYTVTLFDTQDNSLVLASKQYRIKSDGVNAESLEVPLGLVQVEASFGSLAWAGTYYPKSRNENTAIAIHAQIVGAQVVVYTRDHPDSVWDMQWTGDDGTASFFLVPRSSEFVANMSVGDTLLASAPISFDADPAQPANLPLSQQLQQRLLVAAPELLCTGEVEGVRGESGQFPANLSAQQGTAQQAIYHPRGFFCRWELLPDYPELTLTVKYANLLPDESITLYLAPSNVIQLQRPVQPELGGVFQTTVWVERSIFVEFQTTRTSTSEVGAFSVSWTSSSPGARSLMNSRTMVVVLACVSAAGAVLAAFCFYCMCCSRRRRGAVVVDGAQHVSMLRVPSAVRMLLPSKPYQPPPPDNPLPGAVTEPDCCSICLVELESGEHVTVLPCMHFYHKDCIDSWLKRNCTCPLCKANVLEAFTCPAADTNSNTQQQRSRRRHRHRRTGAAVAAAAASSDGNAPSGSGSGGSSGQQQAAADASAAAASPGATGLAWPAAGTTAAAEIELASAPEVAAAAAPAAGAFGQQAESLRAAYPVVVYAGTPGAAADADAGIAEPAAALGDAVVTLRALPRSPGDRHGRLPALQHMPAGTASAAGPKRSDGGEQQHNEGAEDAAATAGHSSRGLLSPAASIGTLQSGTVQATPADFAAAAAAATAALAAAAAGVAEEEPAGDAVGNAAATAAVSGVATPPGAVAMTLGSTFSAAQASVSALRSSSRLWGRRLHRLLRAPSASGPDSNAAAAAAAAAAATTAAHSNDTAGGSSGGSSSSSGGGIQHTVELPVAAAGVPHQGAAGAAVAGERHARVDGSSRSSSSRAVVVRSPDLVVPPGMPGRVAVSIYAYAGHPQPLGAGADGADAGEGLDERVVRSLLVQQQQHQQLAQHVGQAGSSSIAAVHGMSVGSSSTAGARQRAEEDYDEAAGGRVQKCYSLPGAIA